MEAAHETPTPARTVAGIPARHAADLIEILDQRLVGLLDLTMTVKHIHWNVVGPNFISVHEMLDDFADKLRPMSDALAERIRTLGGVPDGNPGHIVDVRDWDDYDIGKASADEHLHALDGVYESVVLDHRRAIAQAANLDPITEDLLIGQAAELELMQWFVRSFLPDGGDDKPTPRNVRDRVPKEARDEFGSNGSTASSGSADAEALADADAAFAGGGVA